MPKLSKCKVCLEPFEKTHSSLQRVCGKFSCAITDGRSQEDKRLVKEHKVARAATRAAKQALYTNDVTKQLKLTQIVFNKLRKFEEIKWFRDRGLEPECISCAKTNMDWCCSHLKTVGSHSELRFDRDNTKLACNRYCNKALSGNINGNKTTRGYLVGLAERFGKVEADRIIDYCETNQVKKWSCDELIEMRTEFNREIRILEKG